jgi:peptidoglycan-associated lipoprotein
MASRRGFPVLPVALLLMLAGCAEQTPKKAEAPVSPAPPAPSAAATPPPAAPTPPPAPSQPPVAAAPAPPPAPAPAPPEPPRAAPEQFVEEAALKDVFFEPGRAEIGRQGTAIMKSNAEWLIEHPTTMVLIEGHTDWKGTPEVNAAMGERRAVAARDFLVKAGITEARIQIVSVGSDRPVCSQKTDACAARNRRVHFLVKAQ